ncbi:3-hydroxybutyryl-CoA dehydratase-like protein, mitochondrial [Hondaea fermentalgiana]|uniref:3-hydroxybutyryl-CoA dehydratase-like protein, mitochondrial n=1 Tax=Hondaea fermentalgiana TaxID=2315210 RepID=A0A2R5G2T8_9STRA|nr:3-hydroxybutyryl-CoA dehydratase-like protein, mitochondrial [Hondaea fermentalgiana]|eukprot:GBG24845.1 3-hydroxybutyryl-CoA dehydratase-like protein, mitochondrial [Hondaea fermentalgiana]
MLAKSFLARGLFKASRPAMRSQVWQRAMSTQSPLSDPSRLAVLEAERTEDGVATIRFNDPNKLNALTAEMGDQFLEIIEELCGEGSKGLGAVVLTGTGRAFSAGGDINFLRDRHKDTPSRNAVVMRRFYERFLAVRRLPVPVVAAINGPAIGAGLCVALGADVRVAFDKAKLGVTFVQLGLHPGMGSTHFLPKIVGPQVAARMLLTGEVVSGAEAKKIGLVADSFDSPEACVAEAHALAAKMARAGPVSVRTCVRSLRMAQDEGLDRALWREADAQAQCYATEDYHDGVEAIAEKRPPVFTQREPLDDVVSRT